MKEGKFAKIAIFLMTFSPRLERGVSPLKENDISESNSSASSKLAVFLGSVIIVGLAAAVVLWQVYNRQLIGRDGRRKADLKAVQNRIETHKADYGRYPEDTKLPPDPVAQLHYVYRLSKDGLRYQLFARLENTKDPEILPGLPADCGVSCNYGLASPNIKLTEDLW